MVSIPFSHIFREKNTEVHNEVVEFFYNEAKKQGLEVTLKKEVDLDETDIFEKDLVISIGNQ